jgi:hypothetical protein
MARAARRTEANECRKCGRFCDRVISPAACLQAECPALYAYDDPLSGRRFMGCTHKVFDCEIDVELFAAAERTVAGFGTVKMSGQPRTVCAFSIEQAWEDPGERHRCINRRFWDWPDASPDAVRAFDLRDALGPI